MIVNEEHRKRISEMMSALQHARADISAYPNVYDKLSSECKHEHTTVYTSCDEDGNIQRRIICRDCGTVLPKESINTTTMI